MELYDRDTVFIVGHGKTNKENAITEQFKIFFIGFVVDTKTDEIIDISCTSTIPTTRKFVSSLFIGKKFDRYNKDLEQEITRRYFGSSQKAIVIAYKDALKKYSEVKEKYY
ncbi:MAG TPA: DUF3870 domain-containing protein [Tissierellales bacterium]|nr:DUF3870 domain-containing protein [Tissierellales bacterium]